MLPRLIKTIKSFNYIDNENSSDSEEADGISTSIMPILYQILDSVNELRSEVKNINSETIGTVIKSMKDSQPQVSPDTALQMQLVGSLMQNPESFMKILEMSEKFSKPKK